MPLNVGGILVFDLGTQSEIESYDGILRVFSARLHKLPHFRKKAVNAPLGLVQPYWIDDLSFSLNNHIHLAFPNEEVDLDQVMDFASSLMSERLDRSRPLWDLSVIPRVHKNRLVIVARLHHALTDGITGMEALAAIFDVTEEFDRNGQPAAHVPEAPPSQLEVGVRTLIGVSDHVRSFISSGVSAIKDLPDALADSDRESTLKLASNLMFVPRRTGANGSISSERQILSKDIDLKRVANIAKANGVKVNDVLITICHGALVMYLNSHGLSLPDSLIAMVPVSIHDHSANHESKNKVSALFLTIPTDFEGWRELLLEVHEITDQAKKALNSGIGAMFLYNVADALPPVLLEVLFRTATGSEIFRFVPPAFNYVVSNVPGPDIDLFLAGNRLERVIPLAPVADGSGITFAFVSYRDVISLGLVTESALYPGIEEVDSSIDRILDGLFSVRQS